MKIMAQHVMSHKQDTDLSYSSKASLETCRYKITLIFSHKSYFFISGSWSQLGTDIDGEAAGYYFGISVSLDSDGDREAIGSNCNDGTGTDADHARVYNYSRINWTSTAH